MRIDYEALKKAFREGKVPEFLDPDVTVEDIEEVEKILGQPEDAPEIKYTEAEMKESVKRLWARIREEEELTAELKLPEAEMEEWLKTEAEMEEWWKRMRARIREESKHPIP